MYHPGNLWGRRYFGGNGEYGAREGVAGHQRLLPSGHPGERSDVPTALTVLTGLAESLEARGVRVHLMPFGWNKRWQADVLDGEWEQRVVHLP